MSRTCIDYNNLTTKQEKFLKTKDLTAKVIKNELLKRKISEKKVQEFMDDCL